MDGSRQLDSPSPHTLGANKKRSLKRLIISLLLLAVLFGCGVAVGRGDINISGLSKQPYASSSGAFDYSSVDQLRGILKQKFDGGLDDAKLLEGIKSGLVGATGDPYTEYLDPKEAEDFNSELSGSFTGIGAELGADENGKIIVMSPLSGYPAERAGLKPKDHIAAINGVSTSGLTVSETVRKIRGPADSKVTLTLVRGAKAFDVTITRAKITVPSAKYQVEGSIGILKISQYNANTLGIAKEAAQDFKSRKVKAVILDLRSNPGGYLDSAVAIASLWLDEGKTVVSERRGDTVLSTKYSSGDHPFKGLPTAVLINEGSASASEITAGALRDHGAATLVGIKTFGKGSVQQVERLAGGGELKVTVARWYTPKGKNIDKQGIAPDVEIKLSDQDAEAMRDPQKERALQILKKILSQ